jgi:alpha-ketoglutarate-dependent taurine dioxygenase
MDSETRDAVAALEEVANGPELWFELPIERGQVQFLNNRTIAHYRSEFKDDENPARKRHLVRTWHREQGLPTYDG